MFHMVELRHNLQHKLDWNPTKVGSASQLKIFPSADSPFEKKYFGKLEKKVTKYTLLFSLSQQLCYGLLVLSHSQASLSTSNRRDVKQSSIDDPCQFPALALSRIKKPLTFKSVHEI